MWENNNCWGPGWSEKERNMLSSIDQCKMNELKGDPKASILYPMFPQDRTVNYKAVKRSWFGLHLRLYQMLLSTNKNPIKKAGFIQLTGSDMYFRCASFSTIKAAPGKIGRERLQLKPVDVSLSKLDHSSIKLFQPLIFTYHKHKPLLLFSNSKPIEKEWIGLPYQSRW